MASGKKSECPTAKHVANNARHTPRKRAWPKTADLRKGLYRPSVDGKWIVNSDEEVKPYTDNDLVDWNGDWGPPAPDWDSRPPHEHPDFIPSIEKWIDNVNSDLKGHLRPMPLNCLVANRLGTSIYRFNTMSASEAALAAKPAWSLAMGEIVPRYWISRPKDGRDINEDWEEHLQSAPLPVEPEHIQGAEPWWTLYPSDNAYFLPPVYHPPIMGVDTFSETPEQTRMRERDRGTQRYVEINCGNFESEREDIGLESQSPEDQHVTPLNALATYFVPAEDSKQDHVDTPATAAGPTVEANQDLIDSPQEPALSPDTYLREGTANDIRGITDICNYYITKSVAVDEMKPFLYRRMVKLMERIKNSKLPFVVLCRRATLDKPTRPNNNASGPRAGNKPITHGVAAPNITNRRHTNPPKVETILGFAFASDYTSYQSMYRFTAELKIFVHPQHTRQRIGSRLMDKILSLLDSDYFAHGSYDIHDGDSMLGPRRTISRILINVPHVTGSGIGLWTRDWLRGYDFQRVGLLEGVGIKLGKSVDLAIYQRKTGVALDPANPPV